MGLLLGVLFPDLLFFSFRHVYLPSTLDGCSGDELKPEFYERDLGCDFGPRHHPKEIATETSALVCFARSESCTRSERVWIFRIAA